jgi:hypothetical protein
MTLNRPRWKLYRHCYDCGVDKAVACRDDMDRISDVVCAGRRLMSEPPEVIVDDVMPAAPVKVRKLARAEVTSPVPVVIGGRVMAFDDVDVRPLMAVRCLEEELLPKIDNLALKPARAHPVVPCRYCGLDTMRVEYGDCRRPGCVSTRGVAA